MDILTGKCSDRFMAHVLKRRDQEAVRWYVLTLPTAGGGRDRIRQHIFFQQQDAASVKLWNLCNPL